MATFIIQFTHSSPNPTPKNFETVFKKITKYKKIFQSFFSLCGWLDQSQRYDYILQGSSSPILPTPGKILETFSIKTKYKKYMYSKMFPLSDMLVAGLEWVVSLVLQTTCFPSGCQRYDVRAQSLNYGNVHIVPWSHPRNVTDILNQQLLSVMILWIQVSIQ